MPAAGDDIQAVLSYSMPDGSVMQNVFYYKIFSLIIDDWNLVAQDIFDGLALVMSDWMEEVATEIQSQDLVVSVRDAGASEWNAVASLDASGINGSSTSDTSSLFTTSTVVAYPSTPRNWGFKNFPPPAEVNTTDGQLNLTSLAPLLVTGALWVAGIVGTNGSYTPGVYSLAVELFRAFTGSIVGGTKLGSRVSRKQGVGI